MATYTVSTTAQLSAVLRTVRSGDVVQLEAGTYSAVTIRGNFSNVTIKSKNADQPAVFTDLLIRDSSGLTVKNVDFDLTGKAGNPFQVMRSSGITIDNVHVHGTLNSDPSDDPATGLLIRESRNVTVTGSEFEQLMHGLSHLDSQGLRIVGNSFHDLRTDGVRGGGSSDVLIARNTFTDFYPAPGDHPDAIQFWTTNTTASAHDIVVTGNQITRGDGGMMQGVFFRDLYHTFPFQNVTITNNIVVGGMYNGIMVDGGVNLTISNNTVIAFADMKSWIRVDNGTNVWVENNEAVEYLFNSVSRLHQGANTRTDRTTDGGLDALREWQQDHSGKADLPTKSMKPAVGQSPHQAAPQAGTEASSGDDSPMDRSADVGPLAPRGGQIERASQELSGDVAMSSDHGLRAHIDALRFAVEGPGHGNLLDQPALSPLFEDSPIDVVQEFAFAGSTAFEDQGSGPLMAGSVADSVTVDLAMFVLPQHLPGAAEFIL